MDELESSIGRRRRLPPLAALRAFEAAARHLSFRNAAEELAVTPTAISHQIRQLEDSLGMPLFFRKIRSIALTPAGELLYPTLRDGFDAFERAIRALARPQKLAGVTLTATALFTARCLLPALPAFRTGCAGIDLRFHASDEVIDLRDGRADLAIRYGGGPYAGLVTAPLLTERFAVLCSPALGITAPEDLKTVPLLHTHWRKPDKGPSWTRWANLAGLPTDLVQQTVSFQDDGHALQAAIAGHGAVIASLVLARPELEAGLLIQPFTAEIPGAAYTLVATEDALARADVQRVWQWLKERFGQPQRSD